VEDKPAVLTTGDGKTTNCETLFVGTGGHRLAPGFQMRGYTVLNDGEPETQLVYVECKGATADAGSKLSIDYVSFSGDLYGYEPEANKAEGVLELNLDEVVSDLVYPVAVPVDGLIQDTGINITALSENVVNLLDVQRTDTGFQFNWQNFNPTKFPLKTHIGTLRSSVQTESSMAYLSLWISCRSRSPRQMKKWNGPRRLRSHRTLQVCIFYLVLSRRPRGTIHSMFSISVINRVTALIIDLR